MGGLTFKYCQAHAVAIRVESETAVGVENLILVWKTWYIAKVRAVNQPAGFFSALPRQRNWRCGNYEIRAGRRHATAF